MRKRKASKWRIGLRQRDTILSLLLLLSRASLLTVENPKNLFSPISSQNHFQGLGYTDEDSAGQSNIFAVEVRRES